jgi:hypothetical protein
MASTVLQMINPVIRELGEDTTDAATQQQFVDWAVDALAELNGETGDWRFLHGVQTFATSPSVGSYTLGTLVAEVKDVVRNSTSVSLPLVTEQELSDRGHDIEQVGSPSVYMITTWTPANGPTIRLWPVPSGSETITVYRSTDPAALTATDTLDVPNAVFHVLRSHVRSAYYSAAGSTELYDRFRRRYDVGVGNLRRRFAYNRDNRLTIQPRDIPRDGGNFRNAQLPGQFPRT